jgi:hypothetical protein
MGLNGGSEFWYAFFNEGGRTFGKVSTFEGVGEDLSRLGIVVRLSRSNLEKGLFDPACAI